MIGRSAGPMTTGSLAPVQECGDWIGLADVLEYELCPMLDAWSERIRRLPGEETTR